MRPATWLSFATLVIRPRDRDFCSSGFVLDVEPGELLEREKKRRGKGG